MSRGPLPFSDLAERDLLGRAMWETAAAEVVATELEPEDFYGGFNAKIAESIRGLVLGGSQVTMEAVAFDLERMGEGSAEELKPRLRAMTTEAGGSSRRNAEEIWDRAARRRVILASREVEAVARDLTVPMSDVQIAAKRVYDVAEVPVASAVPSPDVQDFLEESDEYDWIIPGLLERGDRVMVTGEEGQGKARCSASSPFARPPASGCSERAA